MKQFKIYDMIDQSINHMNKTECNVIIYNIIYNIIYHNIIWYII